MSFTGMTTRTGPKISLRSNGPGEYRRRSQGKSYAYSLMRASPGATSLTMVGATYLLSTSTSPPHMILPSVRSKSPLIRAVCWVDTIRAKESDFSGPSG